MTCVSWELVQKLTNECFLHLSEENSFQKIGPYLLRAYQDNGFIFMTAKSNGSIWRTEVIIVDKSRLMLHVSSREQGRVYILEEDMILDNASCWDTRYPTFSYYWKKNVSGGTLTFYRIDFSTETFVYYDEKDNWDAKKHGDENILRRLPDSLVSVNCVLEYSIPHNIDYEQKAAEIIERSELQYFTDACRERFSLGTRH